MTALTEKQTGVLKGMLAGLAIAFVSLGVAIFGVLTPLFPALGAGAALAHALKWDTLIMACLAINIGMLARHRFFTPDDIDGGGLSSGTPTAHLLQSMLQNTLEQTVLAVGVHMIWASVMPLAWQAAVPVAVILFVIGRILFWRGYGHGAPARALGFTLAFYPSAIMLLTIAGHLLLSR